MDTILQWVAQGGYFGIFGLLVLGIVGLPVPDETMLTFVGYLCYKGTLSLFPSMGTAFLGSACGITVSYFLGKTLGHKVLLKYGRYLHVTPERLQKTHDWFEHTGRWTLTFGYFIPGVRHLTAYVAGSSELELPVFALFAYSGALVWSGAFILLGYFLGERWEKVLHAVHEHLLIASVVAGVLLAGYLIYRKIRSRKKGSAYVEAKQPTEQEANN
jgi:membrane protein DedA with SNARE-associated domain